MRLKCSPEEQINMLNLIDGLQTTCKEMMSLFKEGDIQLEEGKARKNELSVEYTKSLLNLLSFPQVSFRRLRKGVPSNIKNISSCETAYKQLNSLKRAVNAMGETDKDTKSNMQMVKEFVVNLGIYEEITAENYRTILQKRENAFASGSVTLAKSPTIIFRRLQNVMKRQSVAGCPEWMRNVLNTIETALDKKIKSSKENNQEALIDKKMNKELWELKKLLSIGRITITQKNMGEFTSRSYKFLGKNELFFVIEEIQRLLALEEFQIDIDMPQYKDMYVNFVHQIKNIINNRISEGPTSKEKIEEVDKKLSKEEINLIVKELKTWGNKEDMEITEYNFDSICPSIVGLPDFELIKLKEVLDTCLSHDLIRTNTKHWLHQMLHQLRKNINKRLEKNQENQTMKMEEEIEKAKAQLGKNGRNSSSKTIVNKTIDYRTDWEKLQDKKKQADNFYLVGFIRWKEAIDLYHDCIYERGKKIKSNQDIINHPSSQINTSRLRSENESLYKEVHIMYTRIEEMKKNLGDMYTTHKKTGGSKQGLPPADDKQQPPQKVDPTKLAPGKGTIKSGEL